MQEFAQNINELIGAIFSGKLSALEMAEAILVLLLALVFLHFFLKLIRMDLTKPFGIKDGDASQAVTKPQAKSDSKVQFTRLINEKTILILGALIIALLLLFPPYYIEFQVGSRGITKSLGYGFILSPPKQGRVPGRIDGATLLAQCVGVGLVTMLAWLAVRKK